jgi:hypothetical protein
MTRGIQRNVLIKADREEAARLIRLAAGPERRGESAKARMRRTAAILGWSHTRTRDIWQRSARRIDAHEMDLLRASAKVAWLRDSTDIRPENSDSG